MHKLPVEDLRDWIQAGDSRLELVFVSACHSRSAGEAFLQAGVPHVVCCQRDDQPVLNLSCVLFARAFYQALAHGRLLRDAFALARQEVMCCPHLGRDERRKEVEKFVLLPEDGDHNVIIFEPSSSSPRRPCSSTRALRSSCSSVSSSSNRILPVPTHIFEGRQVELYRVLDALKSARIVRVTGPVGIGKGSVVQRVCQYIQDRQRLFSREIAEILWLPSPETQQGQDDELSKLLTTFCSVFAATTTTSSTTLSSPVAYQHCQRQLLSYLHENKVLLVIDARRAQSPQSSSKLASFLKDVVSHTTHTRVICIHHIGASIVQKLPCKERDVYLQPLDFFTTVRLFGKLCQFVTDRRYIGVSTAVELCTLLLPNTNSSTAAADKPRTRRGRDIFQMIGEGIPATIHHAAKTMSGEDYDRMISLGLRKEHVLDFQSRAALEKELSELGLEVEKAVEERRFLAAQACQERLDEMEILRERLHDLPTLTTLAESVASDQELAIRARDFAAASELQDELDALEQKIEIEKAAMEELGIARDELKLPPENKKKRETRVELEIQIRSLENDLEKACDENDFRLARKLDARIQALKERRSTLPTRDQLLSEISELRNSLKQAKDARDWDLAEDLYSKMQETQKRMDAEIQAQTLFGGDEKKETNVRIDMPGAVAVAGLRSEFKSAAVDPKGNHFNEISEAAEEQEEGDEKEDASDLPVARPVAVSNETPPLALRPHFQMVNMPSDGGGISEDQSEESSEGVDTGPSAISPAKGASSTSPVTRKYPTSPVTRKYPKQPVHFPSIVHDEEVRDQQTISREDASAVPVLSEVGSTAERGGGTMNVYIPTPTGVQYAFSAAEARSDQNQQQRNNISASHAAARIGNMVTARSQTRQHPPQRRSSGRFTTGEIRNNELAMQTFSAEENQVGSRFADYSYYRSEAPFDPDGRVVPQMGPGNRGSSLQLDGPFERSAQQYEGAFPDVPIGHTNRLVLEQMIQESISNMAVPALKVEAVDSPVESTRKAKKKGIRTLFGLSKKTGR